MTIELLIEDYERRLKTAKQMMEDESIYESTRERLSIKVSCYRTFISQLKQIENPVNTNTCSTQAK